MTQLDLDTFVTNSQCCIARKANEYVVAKQNGQLDATKLYYELLQLTVLVSSLQDYSLLYSTCFTKSEICSIVEIIKRMCSDCGC